VTAQHVVSAHRLRRMPRAFYRHILAYLLAPPGHFIHRDHLLLEPAARAFFEREGSNNSFFGHVLERAWSLIFDCHDPAELLPCWCQEGTAPCSGDSCQCVDEAVPAPAGVEGAGWGRGSRGWGEAAAVVASR
jgi:hypothetical protein